MTAFRLIAPLLVFLLPLPASADPLATTVTPIRDFSVTNAAQRFGKLQFLGGIEINSRDHRFGGLSGLVVTDGGAHVILESDDGFWVRGRLVYADGRLVGFDEGQIDRIFPDEASSKIENDVEDVALDPADPTRGALVIERRIDALMSFTLANELPTGFRSVPVPADPDMLRSNRGLESVAIAPAGSPAAGRTVVVAEIAPKTAPDRIPGWIIGAGGFDIVRRDHFDISSARFLPEGDLILLERRYAPAWGVAMRLRRIPAASVEPGATLDGDVLLEAGMLNQIDNMEGLSVHTDPGGRTVLTLVSDDNKSLLQRTLLLQFAVDDD